MEESFNGERAILLLREYIDEYASIESKVADAKDKVSIMQDLIRLTENAEIMSNNIDGIMFLTTLVYDEEVASRMNNRFFACHVAYTNPKMMDEQKATYFKNCNKYIIKLSKDMSVRQELQKKVQDILDSKKENKDNAQFLLNIINSRGAVPFSLMQLYYDLLTNKGIDDNDIIMSLEDFALASVINKNGTFYKQSNIQELIRFSYPKYDITTSRSAEYNYRFGAIIDEIKRYVHHRDFKSIYENLPVYSEDENTLEEFDYVYQHVINGLIDDIEDLKKQFTFDVYLDKEVNKVVVMEYKELRKLLKDVNKRYASNRRKYPTREDELDKNDIHDERMQVNTLVYLPLNDDITYLERDLKDVPETFYHQVSELLDKFKYGYLSPGELERFGSDDKTLSKYAKLKDDQIRIVHYPLGRNLYIILGVFQKQATKGNKLYRNVASRFDIRNYSTEDRLNYLLARSNEDNERIMSYLDANGRKSTR